MLLALEPFSIIAIIAFAVSIGTTIYLANQKQPGRGDEGSRFGLRANKADPADPAPWVAGRPRWAPPLLSRWLEQENLNSFSATNDKPWVNLLLDTGVGRNHGGDLSVWLDKTPIYEEVNEASSVGERRLVDVKGDRKEWFFSRLNVQADGTIVLLDGVPYGAARGSTLDETAVEGVTTRAVTRTYKPKLFQTGSLFTQTDQVNAGFYVPDNIFYEFESIRISVTIKRVKTLFWWIDDDYEPIERQLLPDEWEMKTEKWTGRKYIVVNDKVEERVRADDDLGKNRQYEVTEFRFTFDQHEAGGKPIAPFTLITDDNTLKSRAVFDDAVPSGTVTAHFRSLPFGFEVETNFSTGAIDQDPLDIGQGVRSSRVVGLQLSQATLRRFTTSREVDDILVGISSGQGGFYNQGKKGTGGITRKVRIRLREVGAPDVPAKKGFLSGLYDPSTGWVDMLFDGKEQLPLYGHKVGGLARWAFKISTGLQGRNAKANPISLLGSAIRKVLFGETPALPRAKYEVEVVRVSEDFSSGTSGADELFFESITEIDHQTFSFPRRSMLHVRFREDSGLESEPEVEVQFKAKKCPIYKGTFHVTREEQYARWLAERTAPTEILLPDGTVLTTGGGLIDPSQFVYDPDLKEARFDRKWTRNPVWIGCEAILDDLAGGGVVGFSAHKHINWESAKAAADFCDELVWAFGIRDVRSECDIVFVKEESLYGALTKIFAGSEVLPVLDRGQWHFPFDTDATDPAPVTDPLTGQAFTITDDDIADEENGRPVDGITFQEKEIDDIATDFVIIFPDEEAGFDKNADPVYLPAKGENFTRRFIKQIEFPGVRRRWQAERVALKTQENELNNQKFASIRVNNLYPAILQPGDVIVCDSPSSGVEGQKVMVVERRGGSNHRMELKVLILGASKPHHGGFQGPSGGVVPGLRPPSGTTVAFSGVSTSSVQTASAPKSFITSVEEA